ncbi:MAG: hypothetical protein ACQETI_10380 [Halobacteriota archaeon]
MADWYMPVDVTAYINDALQESTTIDGTGSVVVRIPKEMRAAEEITIRYEIEERSEP